MTRFFSLLFLLSIYASSIAQTLSLTSDEDGIGAEFNLLNATAPVNIDNFIDVASGFTTGMRITVENDFLETTGGLSYGLRALANPPIDNNTSDGLFHSAYSVYGEQSSQFGRTYAGYFDGDVTVTGTLTFPTNNILSQNVRTTGKVLPLLQQLEAKTYTFSQENVAVMRLPDGLQYGLMAEEVEQVLPHLVKEEIHPGISKEEADFYGLGTSAIRPPMAYKSINYIGFIPLVVQGINEQQEEMEDLKKENEDLKKEVEELKKQFVELRELIGKEE